MLAGPKRTERDFARPLPLPLALSEAGRVGESPSAAVEAMDATLYVLRTLFMRRSSAMVLLSRGPSMMGWTMDRREGEGAKAVPCSARKVSNVYTELALDPRRARRLPGVGERTATMAPSVPVMLGGGNGRAR